MEIKLAIKIMPDIEKVCELESRRFFCNADETINAISIYSMRKQIPIKPRMIEGHLRGEKYWWNCGSCGASMHTNTRHNYCHFCGQRVDWSEVLSKSEYFVPKELMEKSKKSFPELKEKEWCGTCQYGSYDKMQGYVCMNGDSEDVADFVEYDHCCDEYEEKE